MKILIPNFPGYRVSDAGLVESSWQFHGCGYGKKCYWIVGDKWKIMKPESDKRGRLRVRLKNQEGKFKKKFVHVLVLEAFVGPRPFRHHACHNDGDINNNTLANLRWDTCHSNHMDKHKHGTMPIGSKHTRAKLSEEIVLQIRERVANGEYCTTLARQFGVRTATISYVVLGKTWKHVGGPLAKA